MDKLRALEYMVAAADERSFAAAARRLGVSQPAVQKLVTALERELGAALFERRSTGLAITARGAAYVGRCRSLLEAMRDADEHLASRDPSRGLVVVGASSVLAHDCLGPQLPAFHRMNPDIELEFRPVLRFTDPLAEGVDVFMMVGWQEHPDLVRLPIGTLRYAVVATRDYWNAHGTPLTPSDLASHRALLFRSGRTVLDRWRFGRGAAIEAVEMRGWLSSTQREMLVQAALAGEGVARFLVPPPVAPGLVEILSDWTALEAPPLQILYRVEHRKTERVRRFVEFAATTLRNLMRDVGLASLVSHTAEPKPDWWDRRSLSSESGCRKQQGGALTQPAVSRGGRTSRRVSGD